MSENSNLHCSIDKAVVFLIMAKRILTALPIGDQVAEDDDFAIGTMLQLISAALDQLVPLLLAPSLTVSADGPDG